MSVLNKNYGKVYIKCGHPISVKEFFSDRIDRSIYNYGPVHLQELSPSTMKEISALAHKIVTEQRNLTVINSFNLIALVLNNTIMESSEPLSIADLADEFKWLLNVFEVLTNQYSALVVEGM